MRILALVIGVAAICLGTLWLAQGLGLVQIRPILCFADCAPLQGASTHWAFLGALVLILGSLSIIWSRRRKARRNL